MSHRNVETNGINMHIGHWTQQENPEVTNAALLSFLDSLD